MNKAIKLVIFIGICLGIFFFIDSKLTKKEEEKQANLQQDYEKIDIVLHALGNAAKDRAGREDLGHTLLAFDIRAVYENNRPILAAVKKELGEDFDSRLSNGDYLFGYIGGLQGTVKLYAGDPQNEANMIYPDWNYTKLPPKEK